MKAVKDTHISFTSYCSDLTEFRFKLHVYQIFLLIFNKKQHLQPYLFKSVLYFGDSLAIFFNFGEIISFLVEKSNISLYQIITMKRSLI